MQKKKTLTLKNMVETYVNYTADPVEMDNLWQAYYTMACTGFLAMDTWDKFAEMCKGWQFDRDICAIIDNDDNYLEQHGQYKVIWEYTPYAEYTYHA